MRADLVPERFVAEGILEALADRAPGRRARAGRARRGLAARRSWTAWGDCGARVDEVVLYEAVPEPAIRATVEEALGADYLTFTASSTVRAFAGLLGDGDRERLRRATAPGWSPSAR